VLLALLLAPYLRKFGQFTVPDFIGTRYYSKAARVVAVICLIFISFTYIAGQMRGVGIVFSRFLDVGITTGVIIGMGIVFIYAVLGGMKGITYTQVAQFCVLIFAYMVPAFFLSFMITGNPVPQLGLGSTVNDGSGLYVLEKLNLVLGDLGFGAYTDGQKSMIDVFCITLALMVGTAGLPHVIVRFFTVPKASDARKSAGWALVFIALLYTTAPAVGAFARLNFIDNVNEQSYSQAPGWFTNWESNDLIAFKDKNGDGVMQYRKGDAFAGKPEFTGETGASGERAVSNAPVDGNANELYVDQDIMVLANPEIGNLPGWVVALVAAGGLAAALSTAAGLLLVISASVSHDLLKQTFRPDISEKGADCGDGGDRDCGLSRRLSAGLGRAGGGVRLWPGGSDAVPGDLHGHFFQAHEQGRRDCRDGIGPGVYLRLHRLFQAGEPASQQCRELAAGHFARRHRGDRDADQLWHRAGGVIGNRKPTARSTQAGRFDPRPARGG